MTPNGFFRVKMGKAPLSRALRELKRLLCVQSLILYYIKQLTQQAAVLKRMKKLLPFQTRKSIYLAFILPHFNYCSETWKFCSKSASAKLEKVNEGALRFAFNEKQTQYQDRLTLID